ncbi:NifB/NifX family molybdenum-iron cluster-binding protein [Candidatus Formimonas warabiya]|uniref:Dinitrogenase iron-molybdenum cofactor biosynthesis protein n=1 Tax=Formimonas warabiya TaxID=1761012 RepID=A0A3G1L042_FORW1|nr:NifB/NifX family molybdenum-iron cluster-binding protein [Candidatus Formimonas warabiya]ATW28009.1 dinitrogenase iron-molybdenum cofactor biosynthesis protein [Candidatus Formimonas warabiya]
MSFRVAAASSDGKFINQHFGRASQFYIFEIRDDQYHFVELRKNVPPCGGGEHDEDTLRKSVNLIGDCRVVLVNQIGPGAASVLNSRGIQSFRVQNFIEEALEKLISYRN